MSVYNVILFTNILRLLQEQRMTKNDLAAKAGVSISFLSDLTTGSANPSLKVMEAVASALGVSLPELLETTDLDPAELDILAGGQPVSNIPDGYERVSVLLPKHQAYQVKKWAAEAQKKLNARK